MKFWDLETFELIGSSGPEVLQVFFLNQAGSGYEIDNLKTTNYGFSNSLACMFYRHGNYSTFLLWPCINIFVFLINRNCKNFLRGI